jgi:putative membrane protein
MKMRYVRWGIVWTLLIVPLRALAHETDAPRNYYELLRDWEFDPAVVFSLGAAAWLYALGLQRLWRVVGFGRGIKGWEAACFAAGWLAAVIALVSPLHAWGHALFSAHMVQHEILMLITAPLLVLGRPVIAFLKGLPPGWGRALAQFGNSSIWQIGWRTVSYPATAWLIHAGALWIWHIPSWFQTTLDNDLVHALQHSSFLFSALLFWWALFHGRQRMMGYGLAVFYVFTTAMHSGLLGALITFAATALYPDYAATTLSWGLTPMEDQQLGGLIMWVPAGLVYVITGLALFAGWLRESEIRVRNYHRELAQDRLFMR